MDDEGRPLDMARRRRIRVGIGSAVVGLLVLIALTPWHGIDPIPPVCWSVFDYEVPCARWVAPAAAGLAALVTAFVLSAIGRPPADRPDSGSGASPPRSDG